MTDPGAVVGVVAEVWRYPVKSLQGERVDRLDLAPGGAVGDRPLAIVDPAAGKVLSAKRWPQLLHARAAGTGAAITITLPDGTEHAATDPAIDAALSAWLDHPVTLSAPPIDRVLPMEMYTGMADEETPLFDWPGPLGTWQDLADAHWLTTASLDAARALHPKGDWDVRRFRPTALFDVAGASWAEDSWAGVAIGSARSEVIMATPRCSMPPRAQPGLPQDRAVSATLRDHHDNNLGVYAKITAPGTIAVGDEVRAF
jgi:hypothetical protein